MYAAIRMLTRRVASLHDNRKVSSLQFNRTDLKHRLIITYLHLLHLMLLLLKPVFNFVKQSYNPAESTYWNDVYFPRLWRSSKFLIFETQNSKKTYIPDFVACCESLYKLTYYNYLSLLRDRNSREANEKAFLPCVAYFQNVFNPRPRNVQRC